MTRCAWCESDRPGARGFTTHDGRDYHRFRHDCVLHPLRAIFAAAGFSACEGMNWLQDRGLVSGNCVDAHEVALPDLDAVLEQAAFRFNPAWLGQVRKNWEEKQLRP